MPIGMVPQWPRVVTAIMLQLPSNLAALAGGAEKMNAEAADSAKAHMRLPIMQVPMRVLLLGNSTVPPPAQPARNPQIGQSAAAAGAAVLLSATVIRPYREAAFRGIFEGVALS